MQETYGIDMSDLELMQRRSWRWLKARILSLLDTPDAYSFDGMNGITFRVPTNRIRSVLFPVSAIESEKGGF